VARIRSIVLLDERANRPQGFDLAKSWASTVAAVEQSRRRVRALVRVPAYAVGPLREVWGTDLTVLSETEDGSVLIELAAAMPEMIAQQLAGWGVRIDVIGPDVVREHLRRIGAGLIDRYGRVRLSYRHAHRALIDSQARCRLPLAKVAGFEGWDGDPRGISRR
jgi:predicted DNA-binding transcriptional regulator YafY